MTENKNRCVVTGLGMICAIGNDVEECWTNAVNSVSGIARTTTVGTQGCYADLAAEVKNSDFEKITEGEDMDRASRLAVKATAEALADAGLSPFDDDPRASVIMGSCVGGVVSIEHYYTQGRDRADVLKMPISAIASKVAEYCRAGGVVTNVANACAAGTISISYACDLIRAGKADVVVAGGADAFASVPYAGFLALHALDENGCSPFNRCAGITLGEGAGVVIVESYEHAQKRKAKIYCEVLGAGVSSDAHHITAPRPDGEGQMNAIRWAIENSGIPASQIGYVNAHGTGTAKNDNAEFLSLHTVFDEVNDDLAVSSTKAMTGHCLGAAGAIEAVFSVKALTTDTLPPTLGYSESDLETLKEKAGKIDFVPNTARKKALTSVMNNSFAFGGNNASIIFSKDRGNVVLPEEKEDIVITGLGMVTPFGNGVEKYLETCKEGTMPESNSIHSSVGSADYTALGLKMSFYRKLDNFSQLQAVSGMYALRDGKYEITEENATGTGIIVGTSEGALGPGCDFEMLIAEKGNAAGSAFKFPNTVYNAAGGYLSICSGIKGYNVTVTNNAQSGLQSVAYAMNVIRQGKAKATLATGADENSEIIDELYNKLQKVAATPAVPYGGGRGFTLSDGCISLLLEGESGAKARGAEVYCRAAGYGMARKSVPFGTLCGSGAGLETAIENALSDAGMGISDIDAVAGFANGDKETDELETAAYRKVFGEKFTSLPVIAVKERAGEGRAAAAALACAHTALLLSGKLEKEDCAYRFTAEGKAVKTTVYAKELKTVLVTACGSGGSYCAVVLTR